MVAAFVLVTGVLVVLVIGALALIWLHMGSILPSLVPMVPWLVMVGTFLLMLTEVLLLFGNKDDRRVALRDFKYLLPTCLLSGGLWLVAQHYLW